MAEHMRTNKKLSGLILCMCHVGTMNEMWSAPTLLDIEV